MPWFKLKTDSDTSARELDQPQADVSAQITQTRANTRRRYARSADIAQQRKVLNDKAAQYLALRKQLELVGVEADQQLSRLSSIERDQFFNRVFAYERSALDPRLWWAGLTAGGQFVCAPGNL